MPIEDNTYDFPKILSNVREIRSFLQRVNNEPNLVSLFNQPFINMMITAIDFMEGNLKVMYQRYRAYKRP